MSENDRLRVTFIASSAGGLIDATASLVRGFDWPIEVSGVITDRSCGAETVACNHVLPQARVEDSHKTAEWSRKVVRILREWRTDVVILLFLRRIGAALWKDGAHHVWNLHPSLLPAYPGIGALEQNHADAVCALTDHERTWMGTTLHVVTETLDNGPILSQARFSLEDAPTLVRARHVSFVQKLALMLDGLLDLRACETQSESDGMGGTEWLGRYRPMAPSEDVLDAVASVAEPWTARILRNPMEAMQS